MGVEKRVFPRLPLRGFMECRINFSLGDRRIEKIPVISISAGGLYLVILTEDGYGLKIGDRLANIQFNQEDLDKTIPTGEVVHQMPVGGVEGFGVKFQGLPKQEIDELNRWVHKKMQEFGLS